MAALLCLVLRERGSCWSPGGAAGTPGAAKGRAANPGPASRGAEPPGPAVPATPRFRCHGGRSAAAAGGRAVAGGAAAAGQREWRGGDVRRDGAMSGCVWGAAPLLEALGRLWEVQAPLGSGSSASVYRVRCCGDPRAPPGAVKEFVPPPPRPGPARRPGARPPAADCAEYGFRKERAALEQLRGHRNIGNGAAAPPGLPPQAPPGLPPPGHPLPHPPFPSQGKLVSQPPLPHNLERAPNQSGVFPAPLGLWVPSPPN